MKKLLFIAVFMASICVVNAQDATPSGIRFGVKAGANFSGWAGDDKDVFGEPKSRVGFHGGFLANIPLGGMLAFQPELLYSSVGPKFEEAGDEFKIVQNYLSIPMMLQYASAGGFYGEIGPNINILMSAEAKSDGDDEDIKDSFNSFELGAGLGLGYRMASGFGIGARYNLGLSKIFNDDDGVDVAVKNSGFQISLMYMFGGSK